MPQLRRALAEDLGRGDAWLPDGRIRALMARIEAQVDAELDAAFSGRRAARVEIETEDGQHYVWLQPDRNGDPELPLSDAELEDKLMELAAPVIGLDRAKTLLAGIWRLDDAPSVRVLD
ncbi:hypothetical protein [uncultured Pseudacidovorax sp.]|uniref:hypothetical protein n=1 Tax=uncultured Pseudacidovorax sp. TaxID=679313 RepID=UPI0025DDDFC6|nr:hypothetical protein [uncultured Pseudacidovorax sp.]